MSTQVYRHSIMLASTARPEYLPHPTTIFFESNLGPNLSAELVGAAELLKADRAHVPVTTSTHYNHSRNSDEVYYLNTVF